MEVYIDDLVIKSKDGSTFIHDIQETHITPREAGIKLNPKKWIFRAEEGKFLGYIVTPTGIKVNPEKVEAILKTTKPKTVKEIQSLTGKMAALGRFLEKSAKNRSRYLKC